jgi:hypothetical protein
LNQAAATKGFVVGVRRNYKEPVSGAHARQGGKAGILLSLVFQVNRYRGFGPGSE